MIGFSLVKNTVFELDGHAIRIVRIHDDGNVSLEDLNTGNFRTQSAEQLLKAYVDGKIRLPQKHIGNTAQKSATYSRPFVDLPAKQQSRALRCKRYLDGLHARGPTSWSKSLLEPKIREIAAAIGDQAPPGVSTVYRWHRNAKLSEDLRCLVPRFDRQGPRAPQTEPEVIELFKQALKRASGTSKRWTMSDVEAELRTLVDSSNRSRSAAEQLRMPGRRTLYRLFDRIEEFDVEVLREGLPAARRRFRLTGSGVKTTRILERVEVDHTPLDVFLVHHETYVPLGRPTLTLLIDHYSRMPLGYYLSFGGTSANAVIRALRHAILPKTPVAEAVPGLTIHYKWPCYGLMEQLIADNGMEFHGSSVEIACLDLNIHLLFCPPRQPRFKGVIERFLKRINYELAHKLPGTSLAKWTERGDYDPQKHAVLTLVEFVHVLEKWLLDIYCQDIHKGIKTIPAARWRDSAGIHPPYLPASVNKIVDDLGLFATRTLRHDGIRLHNLYYLSDALQPILRAYGEGVELRIAYDPENLGRIRVWAPDAQHPVDAYGPADYAEGLTLMLHQMIQKELRQKGNDECDIQALRHAKAELVEAIRTLFSSKRVIDRKRAAKAAGISTSRPDGAALSGSVEEATQSAPNQGGACRITPLLQDIPSFTTVQRSWN